MNKITSHTITYHKTVVRIIKDYHYISSDGPINLTRGQIVRGLVSSGDGISRQFWLNEDVCISEWCYTMLGTEKIRTWIELSPLEQLALEADVDV